MTTATLLPARHELPRDQTWDLESIFATLGDWDTEFEALGAAFGSLQRFHGRLGESPEMLREFLTTRDALTIRAQRLGQYAMMANMVDGGDTSASSRRERVNGLYGAYGAAFAFAEPELLKMERDRLALWLTRPELRDYARTFEQMWQTAAHIRSSEVEELLGLIAGPFGTAQGIHRTLVNMDLKLGSVGDIKIEHGNIEALTASPERGIRQQAWERYADAHLSMRHTQAAAYSTSVHQNVFLAQARRYPDAVSATLAQSELPSEILSSLLDAFRSHLPTWHRYFAVRARALKLDVLHEYDFRAPLSARPPKVSYGQACEWIAEGLSPLGPDYLAQLRAGIGAARWVDALPNAGKRQGVASISVYGGKGYVFMNWDDSLGSLSNLAHELGHSLHSALTFRAQHFANSRYPLFAAEVASNVNQALVRHHLLATQPERDFQIALLEEAMSHFQRYFFLMPTLTRFELEVHRRAQAGQALGVPDLNTLMAELLSEGYGSAVVQDQERSGVAWAQFSTHLYTPFYTWQYATGLAAAHAFAARFGREPDAARDDYLGFLSAGNAVPTLEALRRAGVDMSTPRAVEATFEVLDRYIDRLEALVCEGNVADVE